MRTMRYCFSLRGRGSDASGRSVPTERVFFGGQQLEMVRVHTSTMMAGTAIYAFRRAVAGVVHREAFSDFPNEQFVGEAVRAYLATSRAETPIAVRFDLAGPWPATILSLRDRAHEALNNLRFGVLARFRAKSLTCPSRREFRSAIRARDIVIFRHCNLLEGFRCLGLLSAATLMRPASHHTEVAA